MIDTNELAEMSGGVLQHNRLMNGSHQVPESAFPKMNNMGKGDPAILNAKIPPAAVPKSVVTPHQTFQMPVGVIKTESLLHEV